MSDRSFVTSSDVASTDQVLVTPNPAPPAPTDPAPIDLNATSEPFAELPPEPEQGAEGAPEPPALPADHGTLAAVTVQEGVRYSKDIFQVFGYYIDVPNIDPETGDVIVDDDGNPTTVQVERNYDQPHYVTELGPNERGVLLVGQGSPVPPEVAAALAAQQQ